MCSSCGVGCGIVLDIARGSADGLRRAVRTVEDRAHPANSGRLRTKGSTSADMRDARGRATAALVRSERGGEPGRVAWDDRA
ncbi:hypothetical protein [Streptomyces sp. NPDC056632]|uniref:hypothetical protein n=1 Tax=Streptomyces sp. NPDC056632 TaxID=3345884 RepID=UPI00367C4F8F